MLDVTTLLWMVIQTDHAVQETSILCPLGEAEQKECN